MIEIKYGEQSIFVYREDLKPIALLNAQLEDLPDQRVLELFSSFEFDLRDLEFLLEYERQPNKIKAMNSLRPKRLCNVMLLADYFGYEEVLLETACRINLDLEMSRGSTEIATYLEWE